MSSEESNEDDTVTVHPLTWRSASINRMFEKMASHVTQKKSPQARRQMKQRVTGTPSTRPKPTADYPRWALA